MTDRRRTRSSGVAEYSEGLSSAKRKHGGQRKIVAATDDSESEQIETPTTGTASMPLTQPINIAHWLEENKKSFVPPVCNKMMYACVC
jgi:hypothetical protein